MKVIIFAILSISTMLLIGVSSYWGQLAIALPPQEDIPEEILRQEIITSARSPIDGKSLNAAAYAELQAELAQSPPPQLNSTIQDQIFLLKIRKTLLQFLPFLGI
jgi:hypothetical protein